MFAGYWIVPWRLLGRLSIKADATISLFQLLKSAKTRQALPASLIVTGLDLLFFHIDDVDVAARMLRETLTSAPTFLWRNAVVIFPVQNVSLNTQWRINVSIGPEIRSLEIKKLFPRADLQSVSGYTLCYCSIVVG